MVLRIVGLKDESDASQCGEGFDAEVIILAVEANALTIHEALSLNGNATVRTVAGETEEGTYSYEYVEVVDLGSAANPSSPFAEGSPVPLGAMRVRKRQLRVQLRAHGQRFLAETFR